MTAYKTSDAELFVVDAELFVIALTGAWVRAIMYTER